MVKILGKGLIILLLFILTVVGMFIAMVIREGAWNLPRGLGPLLAFLLLFCITALALKKFKDRIGLIGILVPILIGILLLTLPKAYYSTLKFSVKVSPFYLSIVLGVLSGYLYYKRADRRFILPLLLSVFPLLMSFGIYDLWVHRIEYGNWTGVVKQESVPPIKLLTKNGETVTNETLVDKIVLFDFWYISCGPCWVKFPELQRMYEKYESNPAVEIYAVNRPMSRDKPGALFESIEKRGYTFPVLRGTQQIMDTLGVYKYPSVMILNQKGKMVFMGELEDAEAQLESMLK